MSGTKSYTGAGMHKRFTWIVFLLILLSGVALTVFGLLVVSRQSTAEAVVQEDAYRLRLRLLAEDFDHRMETTIQQAVQDLPLVPGNGQDPNGDSQPLGAWLERHPEIRFPFILDSTGNFRFPPTVPPDEQESPSDRSVLQPAIAESLARAAERKAQHFGDRWAAIRLYQEALQRCTPGIGQACVRLAVGRLYASAGLWPQALNFVQSAIRLFDSESTGNFPLQLAAMAEEARCQAALPDPANACEAYLRLYKRLIRYAPEKPSGFTTRLKIEAAAYLDENLSLLQPEDRFRDDGRTAISESFRRELRLQSLFRFPNPQSRPISGPEEASRTESIKAEYVTVTSRAAFYNRLPRPLPDVGSAIEPAIRWHEPSQRFPYALISMQQSSSDESLIGFTLNPKTITPMLQAILRRANFTDDGLHLVVRASNGTQMEGSKAATHLLLSEPLHRAPGLWRLELTSDQQDFFTRRATTAMHMQLALMATLSLALIFGLFLLFRDTAREKALQSRQVEFYIHSAHTLRTPLARLRLLAEKLELDWFTDDLRRRECGARIAREIRQLTGLVDNLLDDSRIAAGARRYDTKVGDLGLLAADMVAQNRTPLELVGFTLEFHVESNLPPVRFDRDAVSAILQNLIDNSVNYSAGESRVALHVMPDSDGVVIRVRDWGIGIAVEDKSRIFDRFYRSRDERVRRVPGTGLGLALVRHVMDVHGGRIRLDSAPGAGTTVELFFPSCQAERMEHDQNPADRG